MVTFVGETRYFRSVFKHIAESDNDYISDLTSDCFLQYLKSAISSQFLENAQR